MLRERLAWIIGVLGCTLLGFRLVGRVPVDEQDREFASLVAQVGHEVRTNYVDEITPERYDHMRTVAIQAMLATLDPHTIYVPPSNKQQFLSQINGNFTGIGVHMAPGDKPGEMKVITPIEGGPAYEAGIEAGDVFYAVDGEPVIGLSSQQLQARVQGPIGTKVRVTMRRWDGSLREFVVQRGEVNVPTVTGYQREADGSWDWFADRAAGMAYIRLSQFNEGTAQQFQQALQAAIGNGAKGLILDLRYNPGGRLEEAERIADLFLDSGVIDSVKYRSRPETTTEAKPDDTIFRGPIVLLVNEESASASEILSGCLSDHNRAAVVGTRTYGKGSVQIVEDWGDEGSLKLTIAKYYLPSGRSVQRMPDAPTWGVEPNVKVELSDKEEEAVAMQLGMPSVIPPKSHATTRPTRQPDRQLDEAIRVLAAMMVRPSTAPTQPAGGE